MKTTWRAWLASVVVAAGLATLCAGGEPAGATTAEVVREALRERRVVTFTYKGRERVAEPHALGKAGDDRPALLAWQTAGDGNTEPPPGWRVFVLAEISGLKATGATFAGPRADYRSKGSGLKSVEAEVAR